MKRIEVLHVEGCPGFPPTLALVRSVLSELGTTAAIHEVLVRDGEEAWRLGFPGSPTIRIDGEDIDPSIRGAEPVLACRLYGRSNVPPREMIEAALRAAFLP
jgi:hypothetical protein